MVIDRSSERSLGIRVAHGPAFEALLSLGLVRGEVPSDRYVGGEALRRRFERLPERLRSLVPTIDSGFGFNWSDLIGSLCEVDPPRTLAEAIDRLAKMDPLALKLAMLGYHVVDFRRTVGEGLFREAALGAAGPVRKFRLRASRTGRGGGPLVSLPPDLVAERTLEILAGLPADFYLPHPDGESILDMAAATAAELAQRLAPLKVVERLTRGIVFGGEPGIADLLVIPNLVSRPWTLVLEHEETKIFSYPLAEPAGADRPPTELLDVYRALADETRLRLLKRLTQGRATFGQLSRELGLAKSTLHHHVVILRTAGLIRLQLTTTAGVELNPDLPPLDRLLSEYLDS